MAFIYKITNDINNKIYIGKTTRDIDTRFWEHQKKNGNSKSAIRDAINKHGVSHFTIEKIEECSIDKLNERERYWIAFYDAQKNGYNLTSGGDGRSLTEDQLKQIRNLWENGLSIVEVAKEMKLPHSTVYHRVCKYEDYDKEENFNKAIKAQEKPICQYDLTGKLLNTYKSINEAERKTGISAKQIGAARKFCHQAHGYLWEFEGEELKITTNKKQVFQYDLSNNLIAIYDGAREAARQLGVDSSGIIKCCNGKQKTCKGYKFSYEKLN